MAAIKLRPSEQTLLNSIGTDSVDADTDGIQVQPSTPYAVNVFPIEDLAGLTEKNPALPGQLLDGATGFMAPMVRRMGPIFDHATNINPNFNITSQQTILTRAFPETMEVARTVEVSCQGTCFADSNDGMLVFGLYINGVQQGSLFKCYFNEGSSHRTFAGSWIGTLSVGTNTIEIKAQNQGVGIINFDSNDFINMTLKG